MITTRTIGPVHLEDMEPHRFEDLIRQLIYDFRKWRALEATGRGGSDDGFDARATEIVALVDAQEADAEEDEPLVLNDDRVWLIQCKREKVINPKKLVGYLEGVRAEERAGLYGIIFAAACDFSKKARDAFRDKARELGYSEAYLWGKGEIEDMLFQPKNDHLLFAYVGISLQARRRSIKTELRARLVTKRKAHRVLTPNQMVLVRDATDLRYPYLDPDRTKYPGERRRWGVRRFEGLHHNGLHFQYARHLAYLKGTEWDYAECMNDGAAFGWEDPWSESDEEERVRQARTQAAEIWTALPEENRAWFDVTAILPYDRILEIDDVGDDWMKGPHIFTDEISEHSTLYTFIGQLQTVPHENSVCVMDFGHLTRVEVFPREAAEKKNASADQTGDERV